jgi:hypothetical protein
MFRFLWKFTPGSIKFWLYNRFNSIGFMPESLEIVDRRTVHLKMAVKSIKKRFPTETIYLISDYLTSYSGTVYLGKSFEDKGRGAVYLCAMSEITDAVGLARQIGISNGFYYFPLKAHPTARYFDFDPLAKQCLIDAIDRGGRSHYDSMDYENIIQALNNALRLEGDFVEIGTFEGRSAQIMLDYMRRLKITRPLYCLDTFAGMAFDGAEKSADAAWFKTHIETDKNSIEEVTKFLAPFGHATLIKMDVIESGLPPEIEKIAFCNLDVDIHEAYLAALLKIHSRMVIGGIVLMEDFGHSPYIIGAKLALEDFFNAGYRNKYMDIYLSSGQILLVKLAN